MAPDSMAGTASVIPWDSFHFFDTLASQDTMSGQSTAVMTTAAAVWAVAVSTWGWKEGSAIATAVGVVVATPAVVPMAAPMGSAFLRSAL